MQKENFIIYGMVLLFTSYLLLLSADFRLVFEQKKFDSTEHQKGLIAKIDRYKYKDEGRPAETAEEVLRSVREREDVRHPRRDGGVLWIDRKLSLCLVTLGTADGIENGTLIDIYDDRMKVGKAKVVQMFDSVSYVELIGNAIDQFTKNYYRISIP